ncbi:MAG: FAD:protein FMN transferase [Opitutaceae bacterium]|jgi:thiamine biosynthesis lipoprotein
MATWFELHLATEDAAYAGQAALEACALIDRLENLLSRFREDSEVSQIGRLATGETLRLSAETFDCLRLALDLHTITGGAFDPALGHPGLSSDTPRGRLVLFPEDRAVQCENGPVQLDLGAIGKGFALDLVAALLREWELPRALLVAGGSSLLALDGPADGTDWELTLTKRQSIWIANAAIGASGADVKGAHILDPGSGEPCHRYARTWACASSAAAADALSTAWMLLERDEITAVCARRPDTGGALLASKERPEAIECFGEFPAPTYPSGK